MKDSGRSESNPAYKTHHFLGSRCRIESPYRGHCTTNANFMHYYKGNPSRWPYICRKFDPPQKMGPIYIMRPCHLKILNFSRKCPPIHCLRPVPCLSRFICCRDLIDLSLRRLITHLFPYCWWFRNPVNKQLRLVASPIIYTVFYIPGGGFLPSTRSQRRRLSDVFVRSQPDSDQVCITLCKKKGTSDWYPSLDLR